MLDRAEQERHREHVHGWHESADQRHIRSVEIDGAGAGLLDGFLLFAELTRMKHADLQPAVGFLFDQPSHEAKRLDGRIILALGIGSAKLAGRS
jgi:hypothetical protein